MILITRPQSEAESLAQILDQKGFECMIEPMLEIKYVQPDWQKIMSSPVHAFISTSKNGRRNAPAGQKYIGIPEHGKNAAEVCRWIIKNIPPRSGRLVYLRGNVINFNMVEELEKHGIIAEEVVTYQAVAATEISKELLDKFSSIDLALFFSARSLETFLKIFPAPKRLKELRILTLSPEIAEKAKGYKLNQIYIADSPDLHGMIEKIDEVY